METLLQRYLSKDVSIEESQTQTIRRYPEAYLHPELATVPCYKTDGDRMQFNQQHTI